MLRAHSGLRLGRRSIGLGVAALMVILFLSLGGCGCSEAAPTTTTSPAPSTTTTVVVSPFTDVRGDHVYFAEISNLADRKIVSGFPDGRFRPDGRVTRQQFAKMIVITAGHPVSEDDVCRFTDVQKSGSSSLYPDNYVAVCAAQGITTGKTSTEFAPEDFLTRAQLITMVARQAGLPEPPSNYSPPFKEFSAAHYPWARKAHYSGLLDGLQEFEPSQKGTYDFWGYATRAEACVLLYNLLQRDATAGDAGGAGATPGGSPTTSTATSGSTTTGAESTVTSE